LLANAYQVLAELCRAEGRAAEAARHQEAARSASLLIQRPSADDLAILL
jgi:hypothetical protein